MSIDVEAVQALIVPDCSSFYVSRPFVDTASPTGEPRWQRKDVVAALLEVTSKLVASVEPLLARVNALGDSFKVPDFVLGEEPPAGAAVGSEVALTPPEFEWSTLDLNERNYLEQICRRAAKDPNKLTEWHNRVLYQQLVSFRGQHMTANMRAAMGNLPKTTKPCEAIEALRDKQHRREVPYGQEQTVNT